MCLVSGECGVEKHFWFWGGGEFKFFDVFGLGEGGRNKMEGEGISLGTTSKMKHLFLHKTG